MTKVMDGQNISLVDALTRCGFKSTDDGGFELEEGNKKFVLTNLIGEVREIPVLEGNDEGLQAGNSANGEQEIKPETQVKKEEVLAPTFENKSSQEIKKHSIDEENSKQTKALEQVGFHVVGEDGHQSRSADNKQKKKL